MDLDRLDHGSGRTIEVGEDIEIGVEFEVVVEVEVWIDILFRMRAMKEGWTKTNLDIFDEYGVIIEIFQFSCKSR